MNQQVFITVGEKDKSFNIMNIIIYVSTSESTKGGIDHFITWQKIPNHRSSRKKLL